MLPFYLHPWQKINKYSPQIIKYPFRDDTLGQRFWISVFPKEVGRRTLTKLETFCPPEREKIC